ncbi:MAG: class F sortase [Nocardioides sp.]|uniref:sortase domain-containing protein n=1 Tax=Nocardioides sp. TaxID=35761 RepID=UPI0039E5658F
MTRLRFLILILVATAVCVGPVRAATIGHGHAPTKGFSGYVASDGSELGVGRLANGVRGICLDTGDAWDWPDRTPSSTLVDDPVVGYLTSRWLPRAASDPVLAAALWWAVGERLNSHPLRVSEHVARMQHETPKLAARIIRRHASLVRDALANAPGADGYAAPALTLAGGRLDGVGIRSATGHWVPGLPVVIRLEGGRFANGRTVWRGRTADRPIAREVRPTSSAEVRVRVVVSRVPASRFRLYTPSADHRQRVAASAGRTRLRAAITGPGLAVPSLSTQVNSQRAVLGDTLVDRVTVTGTSGATVAGEWRLLGPIAPAADGGCGALDWSSAPIVSSGTFTAPGDGDVEVGATRISVTGCYTYVERLAASPTTLAVDWSPPGIETETAVVTSVPSLSTVVNTQRATAGATLVDRVTIAGLPNGPGATPAAGEWRLLGPVRPDASLTCAGAAWSGAATAAQGVFSAGADGTVEVGATRIAEGGCYTYVERLAATALGSEVPWTAPGIAAETTLAGPPRVRVPGHPSVDSGGESDGTPETADRRAPGRVSLRAVGLSTTLARVDFHGSTLTPPHAISTAGIWAAGATPDAVVGTTVLVGHVSDDHDRPGAFKRLQRARRGQVIELTPPAGRTSRWRITRIRAVDRTKLPRGIFAQDLERRLILVTCTDKVTYANGAFHYTKNLIVYAEPAD